MSRTLAGELVAGDRRALARAITLIESTRADHREQANALLACLGPAPADSLRVGISGPPGAGKSTLIEALGCARIDAAQQVAVLAVDPSSKRGGGSILGDKTRMQRLGNLDAAYVRPSPSARGSGGVARRTRETIALCEAAGFELVLVETLGVGQAETAVAEMTDCFVLVLPPAGGDELQGIKRGIVELADVILVNKADGALAGAANDAVADYSAALRMMPTRDGRERVPVLAVSALEGHGLEQAWQAIADCVAARRASGAFERIRARQASIALDAELDALLAEWLRGNADIGCALDAARAAVEAGDIAPAAAAGQVMARLRANRQGA